MTHDERERLIERFADGRMTQAEEQALLGRAASDPELRRMLEAEQVIGRAVARDMAGLPRAAIQPGARVLSSLAASSTSPAYPTATSAPNSVVTTFLNGTITPAIIAVVGIVAIVAGIYVSERTDGPQAHYDSTSVATPLHTATPTGDINPVEQPHAGKTASEQPAAEAQNIESSPSQFDTGTYANEARSANDRMGKGRRRQQPANASATTAEKRQNGNVAAERKKDEIPVLRSRKAGATVRIED